MYNTDLRNRFLERDVELPAAVRHHFPAAAGWEVGRTDILPQLAYRQFFIKQEAKKQDR